MAFHRLLQKPAANISTHITKGAGIGLFIDPKADGHAVKNIAKGTDGASLQHQNIVFVPKLFHSKFLVWFDEKYSISFRRNCTEKREVFPADCFLTFPAQTCILEGHSSPGGVRGPGGIR